MTELDATLFDLARLRSSCEPIVSLYLDLRWNDEQHRERVRLFVQEQTRRTLARYQPGSPGRDGLLRTLQGVQAYVSGLVGQAYEAERSGLALFACESLSLWRPLSFARPFENAFATDGIPHLKALARLLDDHSTAIVVVPSQRGADIYHVRLGDLEVEASLRGFVPRRDKDDYNPGAAMHGRHFEREAKDDRRQEAFVTKARRAAAAEVTALFEKRPGSKLVLVGTRERVAAFERELPERVRSEIVARVPRPRGWESADGVRRDGVKAVAETVLAKEREDEERIIDAVVGQALRGGLAVLGPGDVVLALNEGRVRELVLEQCFDGNGWRCDNCGALGWNAESAEVCPFCSGGLHVVHDLGEALVARALAEGGRVEVVAHANKLHSYRGIGAFLRQTAARGLSGASPP